MCDDKKAYRDEALGQLNRGGPVGSAVKQNAEQAWTAAAPNQGKNALYPMPTRWQLQERLSKLQMEAALLQACLDNWTDATDEALRFAMNLRLLGYQV